MGMEFNAYFLKAMCAIGAGLCMVSAQSALQSVKVMQSARRWKAWHVSRRLQALCVRT